MSYYIRVLSPRAEVAVLADIAAQLKSKQLEVDLSVDGPEESWAQLLIAHPDDN